MLDDFMRELFSPDTAAGPSVNFAERFRGGPADDGAMLPAGATPTMGRLMGEIPLPRSRPDIEGILAGRGGGGGPSLPSPSSDTTPPSTDIIARLSGILRPQGVAPSPNTAPADSARGILGRLMGMDTSGEKRLRSTIAGGFSGGNPAFAGGALMKGAGGGLSGGLKSDKEDLDTETAAADREQKQSNFERTQLDKEKTAEALRNLYGARGSAVGQPRSASIFKYEPGQGRNESGETVDGAWKINRLDGTREFIPDMVLTGKAETSSVAARKDADSEAMRGLRAERTEALRRGDERKVKELDEKIRLNTSTIGLNEARAKQAGVGKGAWNKPPHERYKDAMKLIQDERKAIYGQINPLLPKAEREAAKADADKRLNAFTAKTLKTYGIDAEGNETSTNQGGGMPSATPSPGKGGVRGSGTYEDPHIPETQEHFDRLPPGSYFINPKDGEIMRKKGQKTSALDDGYDREVA
jgi:hypothetical protein